MATIENNFQNGNNEILETSKLDDNLSENGFPSKTEAQNNSTLTSDLSPKKYANIIANSLGFEKPQSAINGESYAEPTNHSSKNGIEKKVLETSNINSPTKKSSFLSTPYASSSMTTQKDESPSKKFEREEKFRLARERMKEEMKRKEQEIMEAQIRAEEVRKRQEEEKKKKIEENKKKEEEHRATVEERRKRIQDEDFERKQAILRRTTEKELRLDFKKSHKSAVSSIYTKSLRENLSKTQTNKDKTTQEEDAFKSFNHQGKCFHTSSVNKPTYSVSNSSSKTASVIIDLDSKADKPVSGVTWKKSKSIGGTLHNGSPLIHKSIPHRVKHSSTLSHPHQSVQNVYKSRTITQLQQQESPSTTGAMSKSCGHSQDGLSSNRSSLFFASPSLTHSTRQSPIPSKVLHSSRKNVNNSNISYDLYFSNKRHSSVAPNYCSATVSYQIRASLMNNTVPGTSSCRNSSFSKLKNELEDHVYVCPRFRSTSNKSRATSLGNLHRRSRVDGSKSGSLSVQGRDKSTPTHNLIRDQPQTIDRTKARRSNTPLKPTPPPKKPLSKDQPAKENKMMVKSLDSQSLNKNLHIQKPKVSKTFDAFESEKKKKKKLEGSEIKEEKPKKHKIETKEKQEESNKKEKKEEITKKKVTPPPQVPKRFNHVEKKPSTESEGEAKEKQTDNEPIKKIKKSKPQTVPISNKSSGETVSKKQESSHEGNGETNKQPSSSNNGVSSTVASSGTSKQSKDVEEHQKRLAENRRLAREKAEKEAEEKRIKEEKQRIEEEERRKREEEEERKREEEELRMVQEARKLEQERFRKAVEEEETRKRMEEERLEQERKEKEEAERKAKEEQEKKEKERLEKEERDNAEKLERKKKLEMIMRRVKVEDNTLKQDPPTSVASVPSTLPNPPSQPVLSSFEQKSSAPSLPQKASLTSEGSFKSPLLRQILGSKIKNKSNSQLNVDQDHNEDSGEVPKNDKGKIENKDELNDPKSLKEEPELIEKDTSDSSSNKKLEDELIPENKVDINSKDDSFLKENNKNFELKNNTEQSADKSDEEINLNFKPEKKVDKMDLSKELKEKEKLQLSSENTYEKEKTEENNGDGEGSLLKKVSSEPIEDKKSEVESDFNLKDNMDKGDSKEKVTQDMNTKEIKNKDEELSSSQPIELISSPKSSNEGKGLKVENIEVQVSQSNSPNPLSTSPKLLPSQNDELPFEISDNKQKNPIDSSIKSSINSTEDEMINGEEAMAEESPNKDSPQPKESQSPQLSRETEEIPLITEQTTTNQQSR